MKSNKDSNKNLIGKRVVLADGRKGVVASAGYGLIRIDLDCGWWIGGPIVGITFSIDY